MCMCLHSFHMYVGVQCVCGLSIYWSIIWGVAAYTVSKQLNQFHFKAHMKTWFILFNNWNLFILNAAYQLMIKLLANNLLKQRIAEPQGYHDVVHSNSVRTNVNNSSDSFVMIKVTSSVYYFLFVEKPSEQIRLPFTWKSLAFSSWIFLFYLIFFRLWPTVFFFSMDAVKCLSILFKRMNRFDGFSYFLFIFGLFFTFCSLREVCSQK